MLTIQGLKGGLQLVNNPTFVATYQWDPTVRAVPCTHPNLMKWTLRVSAPIYWVTTEGIEELRALVESGAMVATTPYLGVQSTNIRNLWVKKHTNGSFLPLNEMAKSGVFTRVDNQHYQCSSLTPTGQQTNGTFKHTPSWDCSDPFNLNAVMMLVDRLRRTPRDALPAFLFSPAHDPFVKNPRTGALRTEPFLEGFNQCRSQEITALTNTRHGPFPLSEPYAIPGFTKAWFPIVRMADFVLHADQTYK